MWIFYLPLALDLRGETQGKLLNKNTFKKKENMAKIKGAVVVDTQRCKGCDLCVVACPSEVLELHPREVNNKGYHYVYMKQPDNCIGCANCGLVCPDGCLTVYKAKIS
jgi:2-oxoglutarate ferredoxin oxidoreductase subunit delta